MYKYTVEGTLDWGEIPREFRILSEDGKLLKHINTALTSFEGKEISFEKDKDQIVIKVIRKSIRATPEIVNVMGANEARERRKQT